MSTCPTHQPVHPAAPSPLFATMLGAVDDAVSAKPDPPPVLVALWDDGPQVALAVKDLEPGSHPLDALLGLTAPAHWVALGCLSRGTVRPLPPQPGEVPERVRTRRPAVPAGTRVRLGILVGRDGGWATLTKPVDPSSGVDCGPLDTSPPQGQLADACRRALALPTRPPPVSPLHWWAGTWLDRLFAEAALNPEWAPTWAEAAQLHPLAEVVAPPTDPEAVGPVELARRVASTGAAQSWDTLRLTVAAGEHPLADVSPQLAAWMDEGMFSRWLLEAQVPAGRLFADLGPLLPAGTVEAVGRALARWSLR